MALDHSKLIAALDGNKNESIYDDEDESELSTDDDDDEDDEDNLSIQSSDNEDVYDLADTDGLEQMMSIREDFGKNKLNILALCALLHTISIFKKKQIDSCEYITQKCVC